MRIRGGCTCFEYVLSSYTTKRLMIATQQKMKRGGIIGVMVMGIVAEGSLVGAEEMGAEAAEVEAAEMEVEEGVVVEGVEEGAVDVHEQYA